MGPNFHIYLIYVSDIKFSAYWYLSAIVENDFICLTNMFLWLNALQCNHQIPTVGEPNASALVIPANLGILGVPKTSALGIP
jgi:hypothetical protein